MQGMIDGPAVRARGLELIRRFRRDDRAATAIEYGFIAAMISISIVVGVDLIGSSLLGFFNDLGGMF